MHTYLKEASHQALPTALLTNYPVSQPLRLAGPGRHSAYGLAELAVGLLQRLLGLQPAVDAGGYCLQPLPRAFRELTSGRCLPHLTQVGAHGRGPLGAPNNVAYVSHLSFSTRTTLPSSGLRLEPLRPLHPARSQALLTFHPPLVDAVCRLLVALLGPHPDALARLHLTGVLYFALAYPGSDLRAPAALLHAAHLAQVGAGGGREPSRGCRNIQGAVRWKCGRALAGNGLCQYRRCALSRWVFTL